MFWNRYLAPAIVVLALVATLNWIAAKNDYYYAIYWYDFMMHFLGGVGIGLLLLWISKLSLPASLPIIDNMARIVIAVLAVGIVWELLELALGITEIGDVGYAWDTAHDIVMDALGGFVAAIISRRIYPKER